MWLGEWTATVDDKGRISVPRRLLAGQAFDANGRLTLVLTLGFEGCLFLFTTQHFERAVARLETQPFAGAEKRNMQRLFFSKANFVELDDKNRLALPAKLGEAVGIARDVVLVGLADRAEIWSAQKWAAFEAQHAGDYARLDQVLLGRGTEAP
jgi:MraZ protein